MDLFDNITKCNYKPLDSKYSPELREAIQNMIVVDPTKRWGSDQVFTFVYFLEIMVYVLEHGGSNWLYKFNQISEFLDSKHITAWQRRAVSALEKLLFLRASLAAFPISANFFSNLRHSAFHSL